MDKFYPVIIDGPAQGQRIGVSKSAHTFLALAPPATTVDFSHPNSTYTLSQYTYHLHRFRFCDRIITIASIHATAPESQSAADAMWAQVITDRAKEAVR